MMRRFEIRNNVAKLLIFQIEGKESGVYYVYQDITF